MDLFTIKVINICQRCYRELKFEVKVDNSTSDYEIEVQSPPSGTTGFLAANIQAPIGA